MDDDPLIKCTMVLGYQDDDQETPVVHPPPPPRLAGSEAAAELLPANGARLTGGKAFTPAGQNVRRRSTKRHGRHPDARESPSPPPAPLNVQYVPEGGVAIDGRQGLPIGVPTARDHLVGKLQKVAGKLFRNPTLQEVGELRDAGGKAAAKGCARAPHD